MRSGSSLKESLKEKIAEGNQDKYLKQDRSLYNGVYLFFSFDLVNSTFFKANFKDKWQDVFTRFYDLIEKEIKDYYQHMKLWKYIGDEVLLYVKATNLEDIYRSPIVAETIIERVTKQIYTEIQETQTRIFIKGTLWIADVKRQKTSDTKHLPSLNYKNVTFLTGGSIEWLNTKQQGIDFLGPDIDLGFRLSAFTEKNKLAISSELAFILQRKNGEISASSRPSEFRYKVSESIKLVDFKNLKGIWDERKYPILWFSTKWSNPDFYEYDEQLESDLVKGLIKEKTHMPDLEKIFGDLGKVEEMERILDSLENDSDYKQQPDQGYQVEEDRLAEIHCAAICFDKKGNILKAKRDTNKKNLAGLWEFGCGQLKINETIPQCLHLNYKKDFGAELNFVEEKPIPVTTYTVKYKEQEGVTRVVPGILFLAIIENVEQISPIKHEDIDWISEDQLEELDPNLYVENFKESAKRAFEVYNRVVREV